MSACLSSQSSSGGVSSSSSPQSTSSKWTRSDALSGVAVQSLFQKSNIRVISELVNDVKAIASEYHRAIHLPPLTGKCEVERICQLTIHSNQKIEHTFHIFWSETLLREVPNNIYHFPSSDVLAFDLLAMAGALLKFAADAEVERQYGAQRKQNQSGPHQLPQEGAQVSFAFLSSSHSHLFILSPLPPSISFPILILSCLLSLVTHSKRQVTKGKLSQKHSFSP